MSMPPSVRDTAPAPEVAAEVTLIPPGVYEAIGGRSRVFTVYRTTKLAVAWTVLVPDPAGPFGIRRVVLERFYNASRRDGRVRIGPHALYAREWALVTGRRIARRDRLVSEAFRGVLCDVEVVTVTHDFRQRALAEVVQYSKIGRVIGRKAGGPRC